MLGGLQHVGYATKSIEVHFSLLLRDVATLGCLIADVLRFVLLGGFVVFKSEEKKKK